MLINNFGQPLSTSTVLPEATYPILLVFGEKNVTKIQVPPNWDGCVYTSKTVYQQIVDKFVLNVEPVRVFLMESGKMCSVPIDENTRCKLLMIEGSANHLLFLYNDSCIVNLYTSLEALATLNIFMKNSTLNAVLKKSPIHNVYIEKTVADVNGQETAADILLQSFWRLIKPKKMYVLEGNTLINKTPKYSMDAMA